MKPRIISWQNLMAATLTIAVTPVLALPAATPAAPVTIKSVFVMPTNPKEGHDPFFPDSTRPYEGVPSAQSSNLAETLTVNGITRMGDNFFVIIGNHTFGVGDEEDVKTSQGEVHVRCVDIKANSVTVEVNGQRHELSFSNNP